MDLKSESFELLDLLVSTPSINPGEKRPYKTPYGEKEVGKKLLSYLQTKFPNLSCWKEEVLPDRFNIYAHYVRGKDYPTILLETHLDTVDVKEMVIEPFTLIETEGKWYGRGSCDAKGQITAMLIGLKKALVEGNGQLPVNIVFAAVVDEEHRHRGVDDLVKGSINADLAIVGEPTELQFGAFHKGSIRFELSTTGKSVHSSTPWKGDNAIEKMSDVIQILKHDIRKMVENITHPLCGKSSVSVTLIQGGEQVNIIPNKCSIHIDRRLNPQEQWQEALNTIKETVKLRVSSAIWNDLIWHDPYLIDPPLSNNLSSKGLQALKRVMEKINSNYDFVGLQYGCDASKIAEHHIPTVVFGPGSIDQAHTNDEWIDIDELLYAIDIYSKVFLTISFNS